jgi:hypothetical protein
MGIPPAANIPMTIEVPDRGNPETTTISEEWCIRHGAPYNARAFFIGLLAQVPADSL